MLQKADEYCAAGDFERAIACYNLAMKDNPEDITAYIKAASLYLDMGNLSEADDLIEKALSADTTSPDAWLVKCRIDIMAGDSEAFDGDAS